MADPHVVTGLMKKRAELAGAMEHAQTVLRQIIIDLDNIDAALRIFEPDIDLAEIRPKPLPPRNQAFKGEVSRLIFDALRNAPGPMSANALAEHVMAQRGLNPYDKRLLHTIYNRVGASLRHNRSKGLLRSMSGPTGSKLLWELAR